VDCNSNFTFNFSSFCKRKNISLTFFSSHSLLLLSPFLLIFYNSDHEENENELDERKLQREDEDGAS
jgi:hypothetical protein